MPARNPKEGSEVWTVSQLTRHVKNLLETDVGRVWVSGEISNWRVSPAGHAYFTLKDDNSQLSAVMFRGKLGRLRFEPEGGLDVIVNGLISVYEQRGAYQIICDDMQPQGIGALQLAFEKLKKKLSEEGLFDESHKKPLPVLPKRIGIVTSPTGAAIRDVLNVIGRRFANVHVLLFPARVQGEEAAPEIVEGIRALDAYGVDVMIVGRGGGSLEDLWPFNEEAVVRAIFEAKTPIISAVGHEIDFTLSDFAADMRAPTPSAAAELVVREQKALVESVGVLRGRLAKAVTARMEYARTRIDRSARSYVFRRPEELVREHRQHSDELRMRLEELVSSRVETTAHRLEKAGKALGYLSPARQVQNATERLKVLRFRLGQSGGSTVQRARTRHQPALAALMRAANNDGRRKRARLDPTAGRLRSLSPLAILKRGYAIVRTVPDHDLVRDAAALSAGDPLTITFGHGQADVTVDRTAPDDTGER